MEDYTLTITITTSDTDFKDVEIAYNGVLHASRATKMTIITHIAKTFHLTSADVAAIAFVMSKKKDTESEKKD